MPGLIALAGGNEFRPDCEPMDRAILSRLGGNPAVVILPTAAAGENPSLAAENGVRHFTRLGARARAAMAVDRETAGEPQWISLVEGADLIYFTGGDPVYLRETLIGTLLWEAAVESWKRGRMLAGSSAGAMILGGKMWFPGKGWKDGLALLPCLAFLPHHASLAARWDARRMRASLPKELTLIGLDEATALVGPPWQAVGRGAVSLYREDQAETFPAGQLVDLPGSHPAAPAAPTP